MLTTPCILVPPDWVQTRPPGVDVELIQLRHAPPSGYVPRMTLIGSPSPLTLTELVEEQSQKWRRAVIDAEIEEVEVQDVGDFDAGYLRLLHRTDDRHLVTEEWIWLVNDDAWFLTATVDLREYLDFEETFESVAQSFRPS